MSAPACISLSRTRSRWPASADRMVMSPRVVAAAKAQVPAAIRSGTTRCATGVQRLDPVDDEGRAADPLDLGPHLDQHPGDVDDLRLAGGVVDHRRPAGQHGRHQDVLGRADRREVQPDRRAGQPVRRLGHQVPVVDVHPRTQPLEAAGVQIQPAGADRVATGDRHVGQADPGHERPEHADRGPHRPHQVVVGPVPDDLGHVDRDRPGDRQRARPSQPSRRNSSAMTSTSRIAGTFVSSVRPTASSDAAISFSALFFAPSIDDLTHQPGAAHHPEAVHGRQGSGRA